MSITANQIIIALIIALIPAFFADKLGKELYK
jgi:photosystem I reaction center subunit XII